MWPYHLIRTVPTSAREPLGSIAASANSAAKPSPECVRAQLDKILASNAFCRSRKARPVLALRRRAGARGESTQGNPARGRGFRPEPVIRSAPRWRGARGSRQTALAPEGVLRDGGSRRPASDRSAEGRVSPLL